MYVCEYSIQGLSQFATILCGPFINGISVGHVVGRLSIEFLKTFDVVHQNPSVYGVYNGYVAVYTEPFQSYVRTQNRHISVREISVTSFFYSVLEPEQQNSNGTTKISSNCRMPSVFPTKLIMNKQNAIAVRQYLTSCSAFRLVCEQDLLCELAGLRWAGIPA